jgi:hypothetical protein
MDASHPAEQQANGFAPPGGIPSPAVASGKTRENSMRFFNWRRTDGAVRVSVRIQRTPEQWFFQWKVCGRRRYSKRELLDLEMRVRKFVNRCPATGPATETHAVWL